MIIEILKILLVIAFSSFYGIFVHLVRLIRPKCFRHSKNIRGQLVVILGAGNDLSRCLSGKFAKLGANLILIDTDNLNMGSIVNDAKRIGVKATSIVCDMSKDDIYRVADKVCSFFAIQAFGDDLID